MPSMIALTLMGLDGERVILLRLKIYIYLH